LWGSRLGEKGRENEVVFDVDQDEVERFEVYWFSVEF
jgi:hypothetical protein